MTPKQEAFVREYLVDLNATAAYKRAGYTAKGNAAEVNAARLLRNAQVAAAVAEAQGKRAERTQIDADYVLNRLVEIDRMDVLDIMGDDMSLKPVPQWPESWRRYLSGVDIAEMFEGRGDDREMVGILKKIKWPDKVRNLELLGKHIGVQAFKDRIEQSGSLEITIAPEDAAL